MIARRAGAPADPRAAPVGPADNRSRRVVFLSHCLLNENVRYLGGAARPGTVSEITTHYVAAGIGICQMPCPEQRAWGGVLKPRMTRWYGKRLVRWAPTRRALRVAAVIWTRACYRRLARRVARDIVDYIQAGYETVELVGVGASPSCGVLTTLDLDAALAAMGRCDVSRVDALAVNREVVAASVIDGRGMFIDELQSILRRQQIHISMREHDLLAELRSSGLLPAGSEGIRETAQGSRPLG